MPTAQTVQTTTLLVSRPADFPELEAKFILVRYVLPAGLRSKNYDERNKSNGTNAYAQLHNSLRSQLDYPYRTFMYDRIDGPPKWVVYVLVPHGEVPKVLRWAFNRVRLLSRSRSRSAP